MDIVERLRRRNAFMSVIGDPHWTLTADPDPDCQEAAAEIERLRAALGEIIDLTRLTPDKDLLLEIRQTANHVLKGPPHA